jgi:glycosyltransferase involved in cell wall biosynthesis
MALIAVDMTLVLPGGENGGSKLVAMEVLRGLRVASPNHRFLILTALSNDEELSALDGQNIQRLCVADKREQVSSLMEHFPVRIQRGLRKIYRLSRKYFRINHYKKGILFGRGVDLLFCPFTAPTFAEPGIPVVSLIHDLQHKDYPQFFSSQVTDTRDAFMEEVCRKADVILCVSESTRKSVIAYLKSDPDKTHTVHNCIHSRLIRLDASRIKEHLQKLLINRRPYMFYPANFWPHKNHQMLITAYGMYLSRNPECGIDLVFTGALDGVQKDLKDKVRRMALEKRIHFLGYLSEDQLTAVWEGCSLLVFPSLYEGFGIPVLEAMQFGKPVICSNVTSLPEVAGDAALYFDPRKPYEIVSCMERITGNTDLCSELVDKGYKRLAFFQAKDMVDKYLKHFENILKNPRKFHDEIRGVYADGWTDNILHVIYGPGPSGRLLELKLEMPAWVPYKRATVSLGKAAGKKQRWTIDRGEDYEIRLPLTETGNHLVFSIAPSFVPSECNMGADDRCLAVLCKKCHIVSSDGKQMTLLSDELS